MNSINITYSPSLGDYHKAVFYALVLRHLNALRIFVLSAVVALICYLVSLFGVAASFMLPAYIFMGYFVWLLYLCAVTEHGVIKYAKSEECILNEEIILTVDSSTMKIETPYNHKKSVIKLSELFVGFEINGLFLIYINAADSIMIPHRALSARQRADLRELFQDNLHDRFSTRFSLSRMMPRRGFGR